MVVVVVKPVPPERSHRQEVLIERHYTTDKPTHPARLAFYGVREFKPNPEIELSEQRGELTASGVILQGRNQLVQQL